MFLWAKDVSSDSQNEKNVSEILPWISTSIIVATVTLTGAILIIRSFYSRYLLRYPTAESLPASMLNGKRVLSGFVTSVGDADNFRFYHTPGGFCAGWYWLRRVPTVKKELKDQTIHIRLAGVDAPELSHFGKKAQPFGKEAMDWLTTYILHKRVRVRLFSRDRYERIVAATEIRRWPFIWIRKDVGLEMLKRGLAEVYTSQGAEYGGKKREMKYHHEEEKAKKNKVGMWKQSSRLYESPEEYKRRMHALAPSFHK
ncbi:unnamed protein product [Pneumocystis jirovecii]|uniref:Probable endonuclease LCL3 n=2 Tax=Pneumocystis jirovecii TaxID=42068 RepID=L0P845_PNEJI|nr:uncharacterized protein T551_02447 [Pneumocystis jirovecii RU7]KTW28597.1 hypothetical protein T551_02447 [Pneumocystis jirovecii RU7]CCJ28548.1 unnamed protein product [Pneumocystis jirovecii]